MKQGIADFACIPVRSIPSERGEMVTQILFGELYSVLEEEKKFTRVRLINDGYEGWVSNESIVQNVQGNDGENDVVTSLFTRIRNLTNNAILTIPGGAEVNSLKQNLLTFEVNNTAYSIIQDTEFKKNENAFELARQYLGSPYLWGGKTLMGIDCSGLVQVVYKMKKINLPRDASQQEKCGTLVPGLKDASKGDLAFFKNNEGKVTHVGILDGVDNVIHSSGKVKIEKITEEGIVYQNSEIISHRLHSIRRV